MNGSAETTIPRPEQRTKRVAGGEFDEEMNEVSSQDPTASGTELHYNPIFEKLVEIEGQEELIGLIAYGRYKRAKKIWASNFHARRKNSPSNDDLNKYAESWTDDRLQALLKEAEAALAEFGAFVTAQQEPTIRESYSRRN